MKYRMLGTALKVSAVGMGVMGFSHGYGALPPKDEAIRLIHLAHDLGCTHFDTAEGYGDGANEELLGEAVKPLLELLHDVAARKNATPAQISLAWMLHKEDFIVPIPGMRKPERIHENLGAANIELSEAEFKEIEAMLNQITIYGNRTDEDIAKLREISKFFSLVK